MIENLFRSGNKIYKNLSDVRVSAYLNFKNNCFTFIIIINISSKNGNGRDI